MAVNTLEASKFKLWCVKHFGKRVTRVHIEELNDITFELYEYRGKDYMIDIHHTHVVEDS